jgi:hypothetical protein
MLLLLGRTYMPNRSCGSCTRRWHKISSFTGSRCRGTTLTMHLQPGSGLDMQGMSRQEVRQPAERVG